MRQAERDIQKDGGWLSPEEVGQVGREQGRSG